MRIEYRHISLWLSSMLMLLCTACGGSGSESDDNNPPKVQHHLQINIYTPEHPVVTRADAVQVKSNTDENVNSLDVWVFVSEVTTTTIPADDVKFKVGKVVGHLSLDIDKPESFVGGSYQMSVNEDFVNELPKVNVYVTANVKPSNTGITLTANSSESNLENATLSGSFFGLTPPLTTQVPSEGLPMSGVLKSQSINNESTPLLKIKDYVTVVRAVSKIRFIFSRTDTGKTDQLHINSISLDPEMISEEEYLFLTGPYDYTTNRSNIKGSTYLPTETTTLATGLESITIPASTYPARYAFDPNNEAQLKGQEYEDLIDKGLHGHYSEGTYTEGTPELVELKCFYFRESGKKKQLKGKIYYTIGEGTNQLSADFSMSKDGDFTRNHTWIVYGYFTGKELLKLYSIDTTDWIPSSDDDHPVFNW